MATADGKPPRAPRRARHAATLADVGREAGVSAMAASAVLNGAHTSTRISAATRARIVAAAEQLRYRPNATARGLAERRMNSIGVATVLAGNELNQYFHEVFNGVIEAAARAGQNTTVFAFNDWHEGARRIPQVCDGRIDGLILLAPMLPPGAGELLPEHTPLVAVHANAELPGVPNIESDEEHGAQQMVSRMIALGHRRILHIGGPLQSLGAQRRVRGYLQAHAQAGLAVDPELLLHGEFSGEAGTRALQAWLQQHAGQPLPQALFAGNDAIALGCLQLLAARGWRVPQDISVAGFDNTLLARSAGLATVHQPLREMGHRAVELLVQRIDARQRELSPPALRLPMMPTHAVDGATLAAPRRGTLLIG